MLKDLEKYLELCATEEGGQVETDTQTETDAGTEGTDNAGTPEGAAETQPTANEFEIDGEKLTPEQIREFKRGYMRQSDYTKKTQELSSQRKEQQDALELYNYLKEHPEIAKQLAEYTPEEDKHIAKKADPVMKKLDELDLKVRTSEIEKELYAITSKDSEVSDVELLQLARDNNVTVTQAYNIWRGQNVDKIIEKRVAEAKKQINDEIQKNYGTTKTLIKGGDKPTTNTSFGLSQAEMNAADKLGMTYEEYAKWK